jgi:DNA transformation protein and related proteins
VVKFDKNPRAVPTTFTRLRRMPSDEPLLNTVLDLMSGIGVLRQRKMFGGVYVYCDDLFIATIHDETLYFNASTAAEFVARGLPMFSYPKDGGIATLQYYQAPSEVFTAKTAMRYWAAKALLAAQQDSALKLRKLAGTPKTSSAAKSRAPKAKRLDT